MISDMNMVKYLRHCHGFKYPVSWYMENTSRLHAMYYDATKGARASRDELFQARLQEDHKRHTAIQIDKLSEALVGLFGTDKMSELSAYQRRMVWEMKKKGVV